MAPQLKIADYTGLKKDSKTILGIIKIMMIIKKRFIILLKNDLLFLTNETAWLISRGIVCSYFFKSFFYQSFLAKNQQKNKISVVF